jgi:hypothetical protein
MNYIYQMKCLLEQAKQIAFSSLLQHAQTSLPRSLQITGIAQPTLHFRFIHFDLGH